MMWAPPLVGAAVSTFPVDERGAARFIRLCKIGVFVLLGLMVLRVGVPRFGRPWWVGGGHQMTAALLAAVFAVLYAHGDLTALFHWAAMMLVCVLGVGRGSTAAVASTLPLTLAPMPHMRRLLLGIAMAVAGVCIFYYEPFQQEWFRSGRGELSDLRYDNPDIDDSGRFGMWDMMTPEIRKRPLLGHGANATHKLLFDRGIGLTHPHNDYLRLLYDYGLAGMSVFLLVNAIQCLHAIKRARRAPRSTRVLLQGTASAFVPMFVLMVGDNIVLYASFFGGLHFAMLGLAYAAPQPTLNHPSPQEGIPR